MINNIMNNCPCCTDVLLRHIGKNGIYWVCPHCRQHMPVLDSDLSQIHLDTNQNQILN